MTIVAFDPQPRKRPSVMSAEESRPLNLVLAKPFSESGEEFYSESSCEEPIGSGVYQGKVPGNGESQDFLEELIGWFDVEIDQQREVYARSTSIEEREAARKSVAELCSQRYFHFNGKLSPVGEPSARLYAEAYLAYLEKHPEVLRTSNLRKTPAGPGHDQGTAA